MLLQAPAVFGADGDAGAGAGIVVTAAVVVVAVAVAGAGIGVECGECDGRCGAGIGGCGTSGDEISSSSAGGRRCGAAANANVANCFILAAPAAVVAVVASAAVAVAIAAEPGAGGAVTGDDSNGTAGGKGSVAGSN